MSPDQALLKACVAVGGKAELARQIGVSANYLSQMTRGERPIPVERCAAIEQATSSSVMRWDLRPLDWWRVWPELRDRADAPAIPEERAA